MTLTQWLDNKWLVEHQTSAQEVRELLKLVDRDVKDAATAALSTDWRLAIAYNAVLQCAKVGLAAAGYRIGRGASQHYYSIESMRFTMGLDEDEIRIIDAFRKKRNISDDERAGTVSDTEVEELLALAKDVREHTVAWLKREHPELMRKP